jgi:hypothetical protein
LINQGLSEHKHCDNAATNANSKNIRSRMEASSVGKHGYRDKKDKSSAGHIRAAVFNLVVAHSSFMGILKLTNQLFL